MKKREKVSFEDEVCPPVSFIILIISSSQSLYFIS
jgi:hypothetical protein